MNYQLPKTIENCIGEKIIFKAIVREPEGDKVIIEGSCKPGCGPPIHTHFKQDEALTVKKGKMGYQTLGGPEQFAGEGETVFFKRGIPHRFWNAGSDELKMENWVRPANSIIFFLSTLYEAQNKSGKEEPDRFIGAYLMTRYKKEYDLPRVPTFVKKTIIPLTYFLGKLLGKYKNFTDAPEPLK